MSNQRRQLLFAGGRGQTHEASAGAERARGTGPNGNAQLLQLIYTGLLYLAVPVMLMHLLLRARHYPACLHRLHQRFGLGSAGRCEPGCIWVHAVSADEVQAAVPLVSRLRATQPHRGILLTTTTPSGADTAERLLGSRVRHCYLPWDIPGAVSRFLDRAQPSAAVIMETEIWPNLFRACGQRGIPLLMVNARLSERSVRHYVWARALTSLTLGQSRRILARSTEDAARFLALGAPADRVRVTGDITFDYGVPPSMTEAGQSMRRAVDGRPVWVAVCTHAGEESILLDVHRRLRHTHPGLLLVLVPRRPERSDAVAALCAAADLPLVRRSSAQGLTPETAVMLGDTVGELPLFYAMADVAFIGGSLVEAGGHSPVEAAAQGVPAVIGPNTSRITDTLQLFLSAEAVTQVADSNDLARVLSALLRYPEHRHRQSERARALVLASRGAADAAAAEVGRQFPLEIIGCRKAPSVG